MKGFFFKNSLLCVILMIITAMSFVSCKDDDNSPIGTGIMPGSDMMDFKCDTLSVETYITRDSIVETQNRTINPIGVINDQMYGKTEASCAFQAMLSTNNVQLGTEIDADNLSGVKLTLILKYAEKFGNENANMTINVNRLKTDIYYDSVYYENHTFNESEYELLTSQSLVFDSDSTIKIELPESLVEDFIRTNETTIWDNTTFVKFFKGFYVTTELANPSDEGCIYALNLIDSRSLLQLTYKDTCKFDFLINEYSTKINMYRHDYSNASQEVRDALSNPETPTQYCFIQGLGGLKTKIKFPDVLNFADSSNIIINKAQLKVTLKENSQHALLPNPTGLSMTRILNTGLFDFLEDYKSNSNHFGGSFDATDNSYTFNIPLHLQMLINGETDNGIYMVANDNRITPYRAMLYGGANETNKIKLIVYYSEY